MDKFLKFIPLVKVDEAKRIVYGLVTAEREDKDGETCHYDSTVPQYKAVNAEMSKMSDGQNIMPLREMHQLHAVGAGKSIDFNDDTKEIRMAFYVSEDSTWKKVMDKVLLGFSQGGRYIKKWKEGGKEYYTAQPGEVSLVDNPCLAGAAIEYAKADGTVEKFNVPEPTTAQLMEEIRRLSKSLTDSLLGTEAEKLDAAVAERVRQIDAAKGGDMKKEQIELCAKALGITVEEFTKQFIEGPAFNKAAKGLAALHGHIEKAHAHHEEMHAMHGKLGKMHEAHAAHLGKCMKACKDVMGSDEKESEKALKALLDEIAPKSVPVEMVLVGKTSDGVEIFKTKESAEVKLEGLTAPKLDDMTKAIADAIKAATDPLNKKIEELEKGLAPNNGGTGARLVLIDRDGREIAKSASAGRDPMAVD